MKNFRIPARCTESAVNAALKAAGLGAYIYRDAYNDHRFSVMVELLGRNASSSQRTWHTTARAVAVDIFTGEIEVPFVGSDDLAEATSAREEVSAGMDAYADQEDVPQALRDEYDVACAVESRIAMAA